MIGVSIKLLFAVFLDLKSSSFNVFWVSSLRVFALVRAALAISYLRIYILDFSFVLLAVSQRCKKKLSGDRLWRLV
jgi:hypothetical protein